MPKIHLIAAFAALVAAGAAQAAPQAPHARLSMSQARTIALRAAPGRVISGEYEKEGGGWRYSFDIQQRGHVQEIGIDSNTGRIVENKSEGKVDHD
ncbi:MAG: peptidase [Alphaproteobacteria bacterium]|nr:peptidase [Alphaproteobacteria bacterium]